MSILILAAFTVEFKEAIDSGVFAISEFVLQVWSKYKHIGESSYSRCTEIETEQL